LSKWRGDGYVVGVTTRPPGARERKADVLWLGGMSGTGKTTAARSLARRYDLMLYGLDSRAYEHASRLPRETRTLDELWVDAESDAIASWFEDGARQRFELILDDLSALPADAPILVEGPQLLPDLLASVICVSRQALFVVAPASVQQRLVKERGTHLYARTRDPERAEENRLRRDALLAARLRRSAGAHGLTVAEITDVAQTEQVVETHFAPLLTHWLATEHRGDVAGRRIYDNDARLRQFRAYREDHPNIPDRTIDLACECNRPGCTQVVPLRLEEANAERAASRPILAESHPR
jgi:hypothetical protein